MNTSLLDRRTLKLLTFMDVCRNLSRLSHDPKYQVATIVVTDDFREICAIGYNGDYKGGPNTRVDMRHSCSNFLHSEENALFHLSVPHGSRQNLVLMCTHKPCTMCSKRIVNSNIMRVIYETEYVDDLAQADDIFSRSGVKCDKLSNIVASTESLEQFLSRQHFITSLK